jgi:AraC-like DNA-binding protein
MGNYQTSAWLISPDEKQDVSLAQGGVLKGQLHMPEDLGKGEYEALALSARDRSIVLLVSTQHSFNEGIENCLVDSSAIQAELPEPELLIHTARTGLLVLNDLQVGKTFDVQGHHSSFHHLDYLNLAGQVSSHAPLDSSFLRVPMTDLIMLLGEDVATKLLSTLQIAPTNCAESYFIPPHITSVLYKAHSNHLTGRVRQTYAMAKTVGYLCLLADHVCNSEPQRTTIAAKIHQIYEELLHLEGKLPNLQELAVRYGASAKAISNGFKELYGKPLYNFVTEQRLEQAHIALLESDVPLKVLAARLGYVHVNHFVATFKRQFGYTPGSVRKKGIKPSWL